jgi:hypothetical protein
MTRRRIAATGSAVLVALLTCALPARACSPLPDPPRESGESETTYAARLANLADRQALEAQGHSWTEAKSVAVVRVTRLRPYRSGPNEGFNRASVKVVRWLKGRGAPIGFEFRPIGACLAEDTVASGRVGGTFVVYFSGVRPGRRNILAAWPTELMRDRQILDAASTEPASRTGTR